jgi:hypothetical protein
VLAPLDTEHCRCSTSLSWGPPYIFASLQRYPSGYPLRTLLLSSMTRAGAAYFDNAVSHVSLLRCYPAQAAGTFKTGHYVDPLPTGSFAFSATR